MDLVGNYDSMIVICLLDVGIVPVHRVCRAMNVQNMRFGIISYDHICTVNVCTDFASTYTMWPTYNTIQYDTIQYNAMQCNAIRYNTIHPVYRILCMCLCQVQTSVCTDTHVYVRANTPFRPHPFYCWVLFRVSLGFDLGFLYGFFRVSFRVSLGFL